LQIICVKKCKGCFKSSPFDPLIALLNRLACCSAGSNYGSWPEGSTGILGGAGLCLFSSICKKS